VTRKILKVRLSSLENPAVCSNPQLSIRPPNIIAHRSVRIPSRPARLSIEAVTCHRYNGVGKAVVKWPAPAICYRQFRGSLSKRVQRWRKLSGIPEIFVYFQENPQYASTGHIGRCDHINKTQEEECYRRKQ